MPTLICGMGMPTEKVDAKSDFWTLCYAFAIALLASLIANFLHDSFPVGNFLLNVCATGLAFGIFQMRQQSSRFHDRVLICGPAVGVNHIFFSPPTGSSWYSIQDPGAYSSAVGDNHLRQMAKENSQRFKRIKFYTQPARPFQFGIGSATSIRKCVVPWYGNFVRSYSIIPDSSLPPLDGLDHYDQISADLLLSSGTLYCGATDTYLPLERRNGGHWWCSLNEPQPLPPTSFSNAELKLFLRATRLLTLEINFPWALRRFSLQR